MTRSPIKWYDFSAYAKFASDRRSVTLTLTDGGPGDADGVANGVIVDPAGVAEADGEIASIGGSGTRGRNAGFMAPSEAAASPLSRLGLLSLGALVAIVACGCVFTMLAVEFSPPQQHRNCIEVVSWPRLTTDGGVAGLAAIRISSIVALASFTSSNTQYPLPIDGLVETA